MGGLLVCLWCSGLLLVVGVLGVLGVCWLGWFRTCGWGVVVDWLVEILLLVAGAPGVWGPACGLSCAGCKDLGLVLDLVTSY